MEEDKKAERLTDEEFSEDRRQHLRWYVKGKELICEQVGVRMLAKTHGAIISALRAQRTLMVLPPSQCVTSIDTGATTFTLKFAGELYVARTSDFEVQLIWDSKRPYAPEVLQTWVLTDNRSGRHRSLFQLLASRDQARADADEIPGCSPF